MRKTIKDKYYMYKKDLSIVDVTKDVTSINLDKGSVQNLGDGYTDNPVSFVNVTLQNSNERLYSPHFEANKVKYSMNSQIVGDGGSAYASPLSNTISVCANHANYGTNYVQGEIFVNPKLPVGVVLPLWITYIDTNEKNPINHLTDNSYVPLIQEGSIFVWEQAIVEQKFIVRNLRGNGTNNIDLPLSNVLSASCNGVVKEVNQVDLEYIYNLTLSEIYNSKLEELYGRVKESSFAKVTNITGGKVYFDRIIAVDEIVNLDMIIETEIDSYLKFVGKVNDVKGQGINTCNFDLFDAVAFDLQKFKLDPGKFRKYFTDKDSQNNNRTREEVLTQVIYNASNNKLTSTFNDLRNFMSNGDIVSLFDGQNYKNGVISGLLQNEAVWTQSEGTALTNGNYSLYKIYSPSLTMETFFNNCLEDANLTQRLFIEDFSNFAVIPKVSEMTQDNLWGYFQSIVSKRGMVLSGKYTKDTETYYNFDGTTKQGTNSWELVLSNIPQVLTTPKYEISERDILQDVNFDMTGAFITNSISIKYNSTETDQYETYIADDFLKSVYQATIPIERNVVLTDEVLSVDDYIRLNNEYRTIKRLIASGQYEVSLPFSSSGTFDLFLQGSSVDKHGLRTGSISLDNTSEIDTLAEAEYFGDILLYQNLDLFATYQLKVLSKNFPNIGNFDVLRVNSPRLNLLNKDLFVQSISDDSKFTTFTASEIMQLGKWKYYSMKVEKGLNTIYDTVNIDTVDIFPPVTNLKALDPSIDDLQNYVVYSLITWDKLVGRNVTSYELQYSTDVNFTTYETLYLTTNTQKLILKEQKKYYIRVRGIGKEQAKGKWAKSEVDASVYLIENPIQNRTWYIRLFAGNDEVEYFSQFDKLGYTVETLNNAIDSIEIIPNDDKGIKDVNFVLWSTVTSSLDTGINKLILNKLGKTRGQKTNKNLNLNAVLNGYYKCLAGFSVGTNYISCIQSIEWNNIKGIGSNVNFELFDCVSGLIAYYDSDYIRNIENLNFNLDKNNYSNDFTGSVNAIFGTGGYMPYGSSLTTYKDLNVKFSNWGTSVNQGFLGTNRLENCKSTGAYRGFVLCESVKDCVADTSNVGFDRCMLMNKNLATNCTLKYDDCYSSLSVNATYLIATTGSDNVNGGFNT